MSEPESVEKLQQKIRELEAKLQNDHVEIEASEGLRTFMMEDMRRIYEDLMRSQTQLMQSDKLATIGLLTAGIVHEINNPLAAANLALSLLESRIKKLNDTASAKGNLSAAEIQEVMKETDEYVTQGMQCVATMAHIVSDIRVFSRTDKGQMNKENLSAIIESVISIVKNSLKNRVTIVKEFGELPKIACNPQQLSQVFLNLIVNASQAMGSKGGTVTLRTSVDGGFVHAKVIDNGSGMPKEVMDHIFEAFFTTKGAEQGTGLGLSITHDIVKKHNGKITVESEVGKGTTFTVSLPVT